MNKNGKKKNEKNFEIPHSENPDMEYYTIYPKTQKKRREIRISGCICAHPREHLRVTVMSIPVVNAHAITSGCACTRDHIR